MKKAFTLVELIVIIAIMGILLTISLEVFLNIKRDREVKNFAEQAKIVIMQAHGEAVVNSSVGTPLDFDKVRVTVNTHNIVTSRVKGSSVVELYKMPDANGVTLTTNFSGTFNFIAENSNNTLGQTDYTAENPTITASNSTARYKITIDKISGDVTVGK